MMYALFDKLSGEQLGPSYPHKEQAWVEAFERKLVQQGRMGPRGEELQLLDSRYEIRSLPDAL